MPATTVVVPCYNEEKRLNVEAFQAARRRDPQTSYLFVNDGSTDGTRDLIVSLGRQDEGLALLDLDRNQGKAEAVRRGMLAACRDGARFAGYWDADLATPLESVATLREVLLDDGRLQIVLGARVQLLGRRIERQFHRHYLGRLFATLASTILRLKVYDTQCGAKLFRVTPQLRELFFTPFLTNWEFDVELLARFSRICRDAETAPEELIYEYPLEVWLDRPGSKVRLPAYFSATFNLFRIYYAYMR